MAQAGPVVGSSNTAVIEPAIAHPDETPCAVTLYTKARFGGNPVDFTYTPPAACPGPWAKVVLDVQASLNPGIQYDRTGTLWIGGVNLWFGTTSEPGTTLGPHWHIQRDLTDYTSLLKAANTGFVLIGNYTNPTDTSIITSNAQILYYPATARYPAPRTPDMIVPLSAPGGGTVTLNTPTDTLAVTQTLPKNIEGAYLDSYLQGQSGDEFWYTCVPSTLTTILQSCGGGAFREGEVAIDGTPAGIAPVYPWIFTGGIDPYLWFPIPGVQTLDFKPFRVHLDPFAGLLSNGASHTIAVSTYGDNGYFSATANLMLYLDVNSTQVTGGVTSNTLTAPAPVTIPVVTTTSTGTTAHVRTVSARDYTISGTIGTSHGTITSTVEQSTRFTNLQDFLITATVYDQTIAQLTKVITKTTSVNGGKTQSATAVRTWPLGVKIAETVESNGDIQLTSTIRQKCEFERDARTNGVPVAFDHESNEVAPTDTLILDPSFNIIGQENQSSTASYTQKSTTEGCFSRQLAAAANVLTLAVTSRQCR